MPMAVSQKCSIKSLGVVLDASFSVVVQVTNVVKLAVLPCAPG